MLRRRHKKSKTGCSECKKRHLKCDEHHPICVNCSTASMACSFSTPAKSTDTLRCSPSKVSKPASTAKSKSTPVSRTPHPGLVEPYVNATHIELFQCLVDGNEWGFADDDHKEARPYVLKHAFTQPFLLDQLLAVSALHQSVLRPARQAFYREEATRLQSHGLRLFNETIRDLDPENIIAAFLFIAFQGISTFFETFHGPTYDTKDWTFFENIVQSVRLLQAVRRIVVDGWWSFLIQSEIKGILKEDPTPDPGWKDAITTQFEAFQFQILNSSGLDEGQTATCKQSIDDLLLVYRCAFGVEPQVSPQDQSAVKYATRWLILVPPAFTELLDQRKPEALLILGHFAVLLHKLRGCWAVGDAGRQLLLVVEAHLVESWHAALAWPKSIVEEFE